MFWFTQQIHDEGDQTFCCNLAMHRSDTNHHGLVVLEASGRMCLAPQRNLEKGDSVEENHPGVEAEGLTFEMHMYLSSTQTYSKIGIAK